MRPLYVALIAGSVCAPLGCGSTGASAGIQQLPVSVPAGATHVQPCLIVTAKDGSLWFTASWVSSDQIPHGALQRLGADGTIASFDRPDIHSPLGLAAAPDGSIWFTDLLGVGKVAPTGDVVRIGLPPSGARPVNLAAAPNGDVWFTEAADRIGVVRADGSLVERDLPRANSGLEGIAVGQDGVWFVETSLDAIGRLDGSGAVTEFGVPTGASGAKAIVAVAAGGVWASESHAGKLVRVTADGQVSEQDLGRGVAPIGLAMDAAGNLWFADLNDRVGKLDVTGHVTEFQAPPGSSPNWIADDTRGRIAISEVGAGAIGLLQAP